MQVTEAMSWSISAALLALLLNATLPPHARVAVVEAGLVENWLPFLSCSEDSPFLFAQLPWDCSYYVMCAGADMTFHVCPPGMVFSQRMLVCDWPTLRDVRRCFGNINGEDILQQFAIYEYYCYYCPRSRTPPQRINLVK